MANAEMPFVAVIGGLWQLDQATAAAASAAGDAAKEDCESGESEGSAVDACGGEVASQTASGACADFD